MGYQAGYFSQATRNFFHALYIHYSLIVLSFNADGLI
jgi:hypothetical protein